MSMGILELWLLWRSKNLLEQIRRNGLTPAERAAEVRAEAEEEITNHVILLVFLVLTLLGILINVCFMH